MYLSRTAKDSIPYADATESLGQPARTTENNAFPSRAAQVRYLEDTRAAATPKTHTTNAYRMIGPSGEDLKHACTNAVDNAPNKAAFITLQSSC